ncbi:MAG: oligosaccharide flippase family protein [Bacilli bacterium]|nr:oligosaccharide flippase family protein [Bacilli bacterium]
MKEKFIKSTIVLIIGGLLTKILGMIIRIITTRIIGLNGIGLYMMIMPTYGLFITIATLSLPIAISKLVSENTRNNKNIILGIIPIAMIINTLLVLILLLSSKFIASNLLQNDKLHTPILAMSITLPFITLSNIIRGYFFGKEKMVPHVTSNVIEQIIRIIMTIIITPYLLKYGIISTITGLILYNVISEIISTLILFLFIPKNIKITKQDIIPNYDNIRDIFKISIPTTAGRIISAVSVFLEPIIITYVLLKIGYTNKEITNEYGIISGYVFPLVMMPQFLSAAISNALLPTVSKYHAEKNKKQIKNKLYQSIIFSLIIGITFTFIFIVFPSESLNLLYNETHGSNYLIWAAPIFLLTYIEGPIISTLQATDNSNTIMKSSLIGGIIKSLILLFTLYLDIKMYSLLIATLFQYLIIIIYQYKKIKKYLKK